MLRPTTAAHTPFYESNSQGQVCVCVCGQQFSERFGVTNTLPHSIGNQLTAADQSERLLRWSVVLRLVHLLNKKREKNTIWH